MQTTNTVTASRQLIADIAGIADLDAVEYTPLTNMILDAAVNLASTEQQLDEAAGRLAEKMTRLRQSLADGTTVNPLGEVQNSGLDVDRLCAQRQAQASELRRLGWLYSKTL